MTRTRSLLLTAALGLAFAACDGTTSTAEVNGEADAAASARAQDEYLPDGEARERVPDPVVDRVDAKRDIDAVTGYVDPVCGMKIAEDTQLRHTHEGVTYGFCGKGCLSAFAADPEPYLAALEE